MGTESKLTKSDFTEELKKEEADPNEELDEKDEEDEADDSDDENQNVFYKSSELIVSHCYLSQ